MKFSIKDPSSKTVGGIFYFKAFVLVLLFSLITVSGFSQVVVKVDDAKQSFGEVPQGKLVELKYVLTNVGTDPLILYKYEVECSCTKAEYSDKPILPGKSTIVIVKFDTKSAYGRQDRIVKLNSNNKNGYIKLRFKGIVDRKAVKRG